MNCKRKGTRAEHKARRALEGAGYLVARSGGSLGLFDLIAIGPVDVRLVQVKSGAARLSRDERKAIAALRVPENVSREYWRFADRVRQPTIERLK